MNNEPVIHSLVGEMALIYLVSDESTFGTLHADYKPTLCQWHFWG
ncbi:MAG: hypothetical protein AB1589_26630 [Cyanobacteriota bacterium]